MKKRLFFIVGISVALTVVFIMWRQWVNAIPEIDIPTPKMPQQNAFDVYVAAGKVLAQHAVIGYVAEGIMPVGKNNNELSDETRPATSADRLAILAANSAALDIFQQGAQFQYQEPAIPSFSTPLPYYSNFRSLTILLIIRGREYEARRDWARAAETYLTVLEFGARVRDNATVLTGWHVGQSCEGIGRNALWQIRNKLDSEMLSKALARLQKRESVRPNLDQIFLQESRFNQAGLLEIFQERDWVRLVSFEFFDGDIASTNWKKVARLQVIGKRGFLEDYVRAMSAAQQDAKLPYIKRNPPHDRDSISFGFQPDFSRYYYVDARSKAGHSLLTTELALQLFRLEQNRYPENLKQLTPKYLNQIPADPFGGGEPLRYKLSGAEYSLYSIGPDGIDDDGRAIEDKRRDKPQRFIVTLESKGDYVAGINR